MARQRNANFRVCTKNDGNLWRGTKTSFRKLEIKRFLYYIINNYLNIFVLFILDKKYV